MEKARKPFGVDLGLKASTNSTPVQIHNNIESDVYRLPGCV